MKHRIVWAVLSALLLSSCSLVAVYGPKAPEVNIDPASKQISVTPRVLVFAPYQKDVEIVWRLPADPGRRANYLFSPTDGIVIEGEITDRVLRSPNGDRAQNSIALNSAQTEIVDCKVRNNGLEYACLNRHTRPGYYKYTIRLTDGAAPVSLDPFVDNW